MIQDSLPAALCTTLRILIVEDEDAVATRYKSGLVDLGMRDNYITIASCVEEAQKALANRAEPFDVMVLDVMLPVTSDDVEKVRSMEIELVKIRKTIRREEGLRDEDDATRRTIEDAYTKRPQLLAQIHSHRKREAALEMIQAAGAQLAQWPPIVVITAYGDDETATKICKALASNPHLYLVKPISIKRLAAAIHEVLQARPK